MAGALAGAAAGFLPFNWARASVFLGDVGSYFLGFTLAALPLGAVPEWRSSAVLFVALSLWLFLADATWTLARRGLRGARVHEAHREHLYQQLAQRFGHARVTLSIGIASATLTGCRAAGAHDWKRGLGLGRARPRGGVLRRRGGRPPPRRGPRDGRLALARCPPGSAEPTGWS